MGNYCSTRRKSVTGSKSALIRWKDDSPTSITVSETQNRKQVVVFYENENIHVPRSSAKSSSISRGATDTKYTKPVTPVSDADKGKTFQEKHRIYTNISRE